MSWVDTRISAVKTLANEHSARQKRKAAMKRDRARNRVFWTTIGEHLGGGAQTCVPGTVVGHFQKFLSTLEIPLSENPDSALFGLPVLQLYFGYSGFKGMNQQMKSVHDWQTEHKILALVLNAGLPVSTSLSRLFVECCERQTEFLNFDVFGRGDTTTHFFLPKKRTGHVYPLANDLPQVRVRKMLLTHQSGARSKGSLAEKFIAGAQLLEAFGADWTQSENNGVTLGERLYIQLGRPECLQQFNRATTEETVNVDAIIAQKRQPPLGVTRKLLKL